MTEVREPLAGHISPTDRELTRRAFAHIHAGTTDMAPSVLRVPLRYYRDDEVLRREIGLLRVTPLPILAGSQVPKRHDFFVRRVLGSSVLVARGEDGTVRAFLNYCRHRGASPAEGCGNTRRFTCPYHGWVYDSRGRLVGVPGARGFPEVDRSSTGLVELACEERHGLVWVVLDAAAPLDLERHLGPLDAELGTWRLDGYEHFVERHFEAPVNWKAAIEAFAESYHFPYVHGQSIIGANTVADVAVHDAIGRHHRICFPYSWVDADEPRAASTEPVENVAIIYWVYPNLVMAFSQVGVELIDILPGAEPTRCSVRHGWMARTPVTSESDRAAYSTLFDQVHAAVRDEDFGVLPLCGDGIRHAQHEHMLIGRNEIGVQHVVRTFADAAGIQLAPTTY